MAAYLAGMPQTLAARPINPLLKLVLEIGPLAVFFLTFRYGEALLENPDVFGWVGMVTGPSALQGESGPVLLATACFMVAIAVSLGVSWWLTRALPRMAVVTAVVVAVFGGLTLWLQDATFIKMKPTIVNAIFAVVLGFGLLQGRSYLRYLMGEAMPLTERGWMVFTRNWVLFFVVCAVLDRLAHPDDRVLGRLQDLLLSALHLHLPGPALSVPAAQRRRDARRVARQARQSGATSARRSGGRAVHISATVRPSTGWRQSGATSASGTRTKARSCSRGCGRISRSGVSAAATSVGSPAFDRRAVRQDQVAHAEQVEVADARTPAQRPLAAEPVFNLVQPRQELARCTIDGQRGGAVDEVGAAAGRPGGRAVPSADPRDRGPRARSEQIERSPQR